MNRNYSNPRSRNHNSGQRNNNQEANAPTLTYTDSVKDFLNSCPAQNLSLRMEKFNEISTKGKNHNLDKIITASKKHKEVLGDSVYQIKNNKASLSFELELKARMMVNFAGGILEHNLAIHKYFGYPYIPGSALKGIARHQAYSYWDAAEDEDKKIYAELIYYIFGFPGKKDRLDKYIENQWGNDNSFLEELKRKYDNIPKFSGSIIFLPSIPTNKNWEIVKDIMTPHKEENKNPKPLPFLSVDRGVSFQFILKEVKREFEIPYDDILDQGKDFLENALKENGVGAKTSSGYGWFSEVSNG